MDADRGAGSEVLSAEFSELRTLPPHPMAVYRQLVRVRNSVTLGLSDIAAAYMWVQ